MTTNVQREAVAALAEVWALAPEVRLGQLLSHLGLLGECYLGKGLAYLDDDEIIALMYRHRDELRGKLQTPPRQVPLPDISVSISGSSTAPEAIA